MQRAAVWLHVLVAVALAGPVSARAADATGLAMKDPTRPPAASSPTPASEPLRPLSLDAIVFGSGRRTAVIDGRAYQEGDRHAGLTVQRIHRRSVRLLDNGRARELTLSPAPDVRALQRTQ